MGDFFRVIFWVAAFFGMYLIGQFDGYRYGFEKGERAGIDATIAEVEKQVQMR